MQQRTQQIVPTSPIQSAQSVQSAQALLTRQSAHAPHPIQRKRGPNWMSRFSFPLALGLVVLGWQLLVVISGYQPYTLPPPGLVLQRFVRATSDGLLLHHTLVTLTEALGGFALALLAGMLLGYVLFRLRWLERATAPLLAASQAIPIIAIAPLLILWFGTGLQAKILIAAVITFFPILMSTLVALRQIPRELREMALISGASWWQMIRYVELPLALPVMFAGIRTGLALATTGAVVGEFVAGRDGLGALINIARGLFDTPLMFVAILTLVIITLTLYQLVAWLEQVIVHWSD